MVKPCCMWWLTWGWRCCITSLRTISWQRWGFLCVAPCQTAETRKAPSDRLLLKLTCWRPAQRRLLLLWTYKEGSGAGTEVRHPQLICEVRQERRPLAFPAAVQLKPKTAFVNVCGGESPSPFIEWHTRQKYATEVRGRPLHTHRLVEDLEHQGSSLCLFWLRYTLGHGLVVHRLVVINHPRGHLKQKQRRASQKGSPGNLFYSDPFMSHPWLKRHPEWITGIQALTEEARLDGDSQVSVCLQTFASLSHLPQRGCWSYWAY